MPRLIRALGVLHPFPSLLNGLLVALLAAMAGGSALTIAALSASMTGLHLTIGGLNDLVDARTDAVTKPAKPIPAGLISTRTAALLTFMAAAGALLVAVSQGAVALVAGLGILAAGIAYDAWLKPTPFASASFALAFVLLPIFAWVPVTGELPPGWGLLLAVAALAGPVLHLANSIVDLEADRAIGSNGLAAILGQRRAALLLSLLLAISYGIAWASLLSHDDRTPLSLTLIAMASALAVVGLIGSTQLAASIRELAWKAQAFGMVLLGAGWVLGTRGSV